MEPGLEAVQTQLDDIKSAIFTLSDRLSQLSTRLDAGVSELNAITNKLSQSTAQAASASGAGDSATQLPSRLGDAAQDRLNKIADLEQELLAQAKATGEVLNQIASVDRDAKGEEDEILSRLKQIQEKLDAAAATAASATAVSATPVTTAAVRTEPQSFSQDRLSGSVGMGDAPVVSQSESAAAMASALKLMAQKLDDYVTEQHKTQDAVKAGLSAIMDSLEQLKVSAKQAEPKLLDEDILKQPISSSADDIPNASPEGEAGNGEASDGSSGSAGEGKEITFGNSP